jgi:hypothetical protein
MTNSPDNSRCCSRCDRRAPDGKEQKWIDSIRERWGQSALDAKFVNLVKFCVCFTAERRLRGRLRKGRHLRGPGWIRKPLKVTAVLAAKYPRLANDQKINLTARRDLKLVTDWVNGKRLRDDQRRRVRYLTECGDKEGQGGGVGSGSFLFQNFKLVISGWGETNLSELLDCPSLQNEMFGPLLGLGKRKLPTGRAVARFLRYLVHNPEIVVMLKTRMWLDLEPFGFDLDGMKQELYVNHPEYQAVLDGMIDDYGFDECVGALEHHGFGPVVDWENIDGASDLQLHEGEIEFDCTAGAMSLLRARMIIKLKKWIALGCPSRGGTNS